MTQTTITRREIINTLSRELPLKQPHISEILETVLDVISTNLIQGNQVKLSSFGTFDVRYKNTRIGRNPKTKEEVTIAPRKSISFRASKLLKDRTDLKR